MSEQPCVEEGSSTGEAAADTKVGATAVDSTDGEHSECQAEGVKGTRESETEESPKKGMYNLLP